MLDASRIQPLLRQVGLLLEQAGQRLEYVAIGGGALLLAGRITRATVDLDLLTQVSQTGFQEPLPFPAVLTKAIHDVSRAAGLATDWINAAPRSLLDLPKPPGFLSELSKHDFGGLVLWIPSRADFVLMKVFAAADHAATDANKHLDDLIALGATRTEIDDASRTITAYWDPSPGFEWQLQQLRERLDDA